MQHAQFTPEGNAVIMVHNYDIYYRRTPRAPETYRVTNDAVPGIVYNGVPDWLYEGNYTENSTNRYASVVTHQFPIEFGHFSEEILRTASTIWMSSDGHLMLFGTFNDSMVDEQKYAWYGTTNPQNGNAYLYPEIRSLR